MVLQTGFLWMKKGVFHNYFLHNYIDNYNFDNNVTWKKRILAEFDKATDNELENLSGEGVFKKGLA